jgi:hypothetical protein
MNAKKTARPTDRNGSIPDKGKRGSMTIRST